MKKTDFEILDSRKASLNARIKFIVVREGKIFLRILSIGNKDALELITATANDEGRPYPLALDKDRIFTAASNLHKKIFSKAPSIKRDRENRPYISLGYAENKHNDILAETIEDWIEAFFQEYDSLQPHQIEAFQCNHNPVSKTSNTKSKTNDLSMIDVYHSLSDSCQYDGAPIYLSDGMWLSPDGSMEDRSR